MLQPLTKYLFQYRTVSIPQVGTIQIIQHPAQLDVVGKSITPPSFFVELKNKDDVPKHQLDFLQSFLGRTKDDVLLDLNFFGSALHEKINGTGFEWERLGTFTRSTQRLPIKLNSIGPVTAEKVTRADAEHQILVGDQHRTSVQMAGRRTVSEVAVKERAWYIVAGWILLILSVLAIVFFLYTGKFKVNAAGSKQEIIGCQAIIDTSFV